MENIIDLLPLDLGDLGIVTEAELAMPGVYDAVLEYPETGVATEAFIVFRNAVEISAAAKQYGKTDPDHPDFLVYMEDGEETPGTSSAMSCSTIKYCTACHCRRETPSAA